MVLFIKELNAIAVVGGQQRGTVNDHSNPPSDVIDVIDLSSMKMYSNTLPSGARDDGNMILLPSPNNDGQVQLLVLQGVKEIYDATRLSGKATAQPEVITIQK